MMCPKCLIQLNSTDDLIAGKPHYKYSCQNHFFYYIDKNDSSVIMIINYVIREDGAFIQYCWNGKRQVGEIYLFNFRNPIHFGKTKELTPAEAWKLVNRYKDLLIFA